MNRNSKLTRQNYESFMVYLLFGKDNYLEACFDKAYLDFNRTLHQIGEHPQKETVYQGAKNVLKAAFIKLQNKTIAQLEFDKWHQATCIALSDLYSNHGYGNFYIGQGQKWINMSFKYIYTVGEEHLSGFSRIYPLCHAPLDNILLEQLSKYKLPPLTCAWSRLSNYEEYLNIQRWIRKKFTLVPLDVEYFLWSGENLELEHSDE